MNWINIKEKLPPFSNYKEYLVFDGFDFYIARPGFWGPADDGEYGIYEWYDLGDPEGGRIRREITHWCELTYPKAAKAKSP